MNFNLNIMKTAFNIARVELQTLFYSPMAWIILIMFSFQAGMAFTMSYSSFVSSQTLGFSLPGGLSYRAFGYGAGVFGIMQGYLYLYLPLITMGLMSRELASGSIKLLYSSPVSNVQIIMGKFISMMLYGLVLVGILFLYVVFAACTMKDFDFPLVITGLFGLYLLLCAYSAIGLFMSTLTSYQVLAAMFTFATLGVLNYVGSWWQDIDFVRDLTWWLAISGRVNTFLNGMICSEDLLYFLIVITMFLSFSFIKLYAVRQKTHWSATWGKYVGVLAVALLLGYLSSRPKLMGYLDVTATKMNTLTKNSQDIVSKLDGGLTITTYVNLLDTKFNVGLPKYKNQDMRRFERYTRFKPEIEMKYVYYYDKANNPKLDERYPDLNDRERMKKLANSYDLDTNMFLRPEEIKQLIDLSGEGNRFVREIKRENGAKTFLRLFEDATVFPTEAEISAALKRLVMELPTVAFLTGHGERDCTKEGDRDYNRFAWEKVYRYALINNGFDVMEVSLENEIPQEVDILVIADAKEVFTESELNNLQRYIDKGGDLVIAGEVGRQNIMNPIVEKIGIRFMDGQIASPSEHYDANLILAEPTIKGRELTYMFDAIAYSDAVVVMPGCTALEQIADKGFEVLPVFETVDSAAWNELQTLDFINEKVEYDSLSGEKRQTWITSMALCREIAGKKQRILVLGDADCLSNIELSRSRAGITAVNYALISGAFYWLSDEEVPIDVRRPSMTDNEVFIGEGLMSVFDFFFHWGIPIIFLFTTIFLWIRRRGR